MSEGMGNSADQPWMVLAHRSSPLAGLFPSEGKRMLGDQSRVDDDGLEDGNGPLADVETTPVPPVPSNLS
jgi:hypothetical protein